MKRDQTRRDEMRRDEMTLDSWFERGLGAIWTLRGTSTVRRDVSRWRHRGRNDVTGDVVVRRRRRLASLSAADGETRRQPAARTRRSGRGQRCWGPGHRGSRDDRCAKTRRTFWPALHHAIVDFPNVLHILWTALGIFGVTHRTRRQEYLISLTGVCCCLSSDVDLIYFYLFLRQICLWKRYRKDYKVMAFSLVDPRNSIWCVYDIKYS